MWPAFTPTFLCRAIFRGCAEIFIFRRHIHLCLKISGGLPSKIGGVQEEGGQAGPVKTRCLRWEVSQIDSLRFVGQIFTPEVSPVRYIDLGNISEFGISNRATWNRYIFAKWSIFTSSDQKFVRPTKRPAAMPTEKKGRAVEKVNCFSSFLVFWKLTAFLSVQKCVFKVPLLIGLSLAFTGRDKGRACWGQEGEGRRAKKSIFCRFRDYYDYHSDGHLICCLPDEEKSKTLSSYKHRLNAFWLSLTDTWQLIKSLLHVEHDFFWVKMGKERGTEGSQEKEWMSLNDCSLNSCSYGPRFLRLHFKSC